MSRHVSIVVDHILIRKKNLVQPKVNSAEHARNQTISKKFAVQRSRKAIILRKQNSENLIVQYKLFNLEEKLTNLRHSVQRLPMMKLYLEYKMRKRVLQSPQKLELKLEIAKSTRSSTLEQASTSFFHFSTF